MQRLLRAFFYSLAGLKAAYKNEPAFRQEIFCSLILIPITFLIDITKLEQAMLIGSLLLILIVELINSAIEAVVDRISAKKHDLSKIAKDCGSAAVLVSIVNAIIIWTLVLI